MNGFDYAVIAIIILSALLGWWRGLVIEMLSLVGWVVAYMVARMFAASIEPMMPAFLGAEAVKMAAAFVLLFIVVLVACSFIARALSKMVKWVGMGWLDGWLGAVFGVVRGLVIIAAIVLLAGMTSIPKEPFWRHAWLSAPLQNFALMAKGFLPEKMAQQLHYQD